MAYVESSSTQHVEANTYLTFSISDQVFAVDVCNVREILDVQKISRLPNSPHDLIGVIDVRSQGVGVIDLASRLGLSLDGNENQRIIVFELAISSDPIPIGVFADRVLSVAEIPNIEIEKPPSTLSTWDSSVVRGVTRINNKIVIILLLASIFNIEGEDKGIFEFS